MSSASFPCRIALATTVAMVAAVPMFQARAQDPQLDQARAEMMNRGGRGASDNERSMSDAVRRVQRTTGGRILGAERVPFDGRDINRVKYMDDRGRVRYMDDPAPARSQPRQPRSDMSSLRGDNP
ncbi:hypothetical protein [Stenotrophomonas sp. 24(2023)]|uniref:hypothetical protein n=1 Tax=Stenotrophomonas sp. 24(2023) TaxID=3068324 RepID=UPI0027DF4205|nr:hypothetical protein [Stenotrophomonas sp. 24(2023)]WMJ71327.1 hypothetical protein Q9R17_09595 [Stenotrophomonas sp. 24(2023)]